MLRLMRDKAGSWFIKVILGAIVIVFIFWGVGSFRSQRLNKIAEVNGTPITIEEYNQAYNRLVERYRRQFGNSLDEKMIKMLGLGRQALDQLINETLLKQEAEKLNFKISDKELADAIQSIPAFQNGGRFDNRLYARVLTMNRLKPEEFEKMQRDGMIADGLRSFVMANVKISDSEARYWYDWKNMSVKIQYTVFDPESYKNIEVSEKDIKDYFDKHKESYKTEPEVKAQYVVFTPEQYMDKAEVSEDEIKDYYEENPNEFKKEKTVEARHILLKVDPKSTGKEIEEIRKKAEDIMKMARDGKDFAELAKKYSQGPTKDKGGYLGTFKKSTMVRPFAEKAFSMKAGEISEPVKTRFGWHIIKVEKVNEASTQTLEQVKDKIKKKLAKEKARSMAFDEAEKIYDSIYEGDDIKKALKDRAEVKETDYFTRKGPDKLPNRSGFARVAFQLSKMQMSEIQDFPDGYYIIQVTDKLPAEIAKYEDVHDKVKAALIKTRQENKAKADAAKLLGELKKGESFEALAEKFKIKVKTTGFFKRNSAIPDLGTEQAVNKMAFQLSREKTFPDAPVKGRKGFYIIAFKDKKMPDPKGFETEKESIKKRLLERRQKQAFNTWLATLKAKSEIFIKDDLIN